MIVQKKLPLTLPESEKTPVDAIKYAFYKVLGSNYIFKSNTII
jgi:hypothetical protein